MKFDSLDEARIHYNKYAKHIGFSVRCSSSRKSVLDHERDKQVFICNKADKNDENKVPVVKLRNRLITKRYECKAKMRVKRIGDRWEVTQFVEEHTHEVTNKFALKKYLRSHKNIPKEEMHFIDLLHGVNLSAGRIMEIMTELYGSRANVPYDTKKISNYTAKHNEKLRHIDIPELLEYFEELKKEDPNFFYRYKLDKDSRVENLFWVDARSEGFNAVLKKYTTPHGSLLHFFEQYMKLQEKIDCTEDHNEFEGDDKTLRVWGDFPMEEQMLKTYTIPIFRKFQEELRKITSYNVMLLHDGTYEVSPITGYCFGYGRRSYIVTADLPQQIYNCQCCKFNRDGILCCHVMKVMSAIGAVLEMPQHYILPRWCIPPPDVVPPEPVAIPEPSQKLLPYGNLTNYFATVI
ncbi:hypothetical protein ACQ4PT_039848 [Festuca glaucescens]